MSFSIKGKAWLFGNDISTDFMAPAATKWGSWEETKQYILKNANPNFSKEVKEGDVIVAGHNFGCGSSREKAPQNLIDLGVKCVIAESFGRIFFRNCIALGLPIIKCPKVRSIFKQGEIAFVDLEKAIVKNCSREFSLNAEPLPLQIINTLKMGGIIPLLKI